LTAYTVDINNGRKNSKPLESSGRNSQQQSMQPRVDAQTSQPSPWFSDLQNDKREEHYFRNIAVDDGGEAFSLMNRNLPIYMHCPHCKMSERKEHQDVKFAGAVSQLQRIFIVSYDFKLKFYIVFRYDEVSSFTHLQQEKKILDSSKDGC